MFEDIDKETERIQEGIRLLKRMNLIDALVNRALNGNNTSEVFRLIRASMNLAVQYRHLFG